MRFHTVYCTPLGEERREEDVRGEKRREERREEEKLSVCLTICSLLFCLPVSLSTCIPVCLCVCVYICQDKEVVSMAAASVCCRAHQRLTVSSNQLQPAAMQAG